jgi:CHASE3 domain sensor protein
MRMGGNGAVVLPIQAASGWWRRNEMKGSGSSSLITSGISFGATILAGFVSALVAITLIGVATYWSVKNLVKSGDRAAHSHQVIDHLEALHFLPNDAETREHDYLITGDRYNLELYQAAIAKIDEEVHSLGTLINRALHTRLLLLSQRDIDLQTQSRFMEAVLSSMDEGVVVLGVT